MSSCMAEQIIPDEVTDLAQCVVNLGRVNQLSAAMTARSKWLKDSANAQITNFKNQQQATDNQLVQTVRTQMLNNGDALKRALVYSTDQYYQFRDQQNSQQYQAGLLHVSMLEL